MKFSFGASMEPIDIRRAASPRERKASRVLCLLLLVILVPVSLLFIAPAFLGNFKYVPLALIFGGMTAAVLFVYARARSSEKSTGLSPIASICVGLFLACVSLWILIISNDFSSIHTSAILFVSGIFAMLHGYKKMKTISYLTAELERTHMELN